MQLDLLADRKSLPVMDIFILGLQSPAEVQAYLGSYSPPTSYSHSAGHGTTPNTSELRLQTSPDQPWRLLVPVWPRLSGHRPVAGFIFQPVTGTHIFLGTEVICSCKYVRNLGFCDMGLMCQQPSS